MGVSVRAEFAGAWDFEGIEASAIAEAWRIRREVAGFVARRAAELAPVRSGRLAASIRVVEPPTPDGDWLVEIPVAYAAAQELGAGGRPGRGFLAQATAEGRLLYGELVDAVRFGRP